MIPRIIHQTWKDGDLPERFIESQQSWQIKNPGWTYKFWTDAELDCFVAEKYPEMLPLYRAYPEQIQRVDAARYMILHYYGGVYSDLDIICQRSFEEFLHEKVVLRANAPGSITNDLMLSEPGHPFFAYVIDSLAGAYKRWQRRYLLRTFRVFLTTGPYFLALAYHRYKPKDDLTIRAREFNRPREVPSGDDDSHVKHIYGSSWYSWDTFVITFLYQRLRLVRLMALIAGDRWSLAASASESSAERMQDLEDVTSPVAVWAHDRIRKAPPDLLSR